MGWNGGQEEQEQFIRSTLGRHVLLLAGKSSSQDSLMRNSNSLWIRHWNRVA
jgi:hypothetical protein